MMLGLEMRDDELQRSHMDGEVDNPKKGEVGLQPFGGAPDPAGEGDRVSATGNAHQAKPPTRSVVGASP